MKLNFILQNNGHTIINENCDYEVINDEIIFFYDDLTLKILVNDTYAHFIRESKTDKLEIKKLTDKISARVFLLDPPCSMDILVNKFEAIKENKKINITYTIESDETSEKTIILTLVN